jgi:hypothetical protein
MSESTNTNPVARPRLRESLDKVRPEMVALEQNDLLQINVDPLAAVATARGALAQILTLRSQMQALSGFDIRQLDNLELYALATMQAQTIYLGASAPPQRFQELVAEATDLREQLLADATALATRGHVSGTKLGTLKGAVGYRNVASDLLTLTNMIRGNWDTVSGKTGVTEVELDRAEVVGDQLINDIGVRELAPAAVAAVALERQQAFTLFATAYDQVRRAVNYLRWDAGDADEIAPSFFVNRRKKSSSEVAPAPEATPATVITGMPTPAVAAAAVAKPAEGLPGADPFVH